MNAFRWILSGGALAAMLAAFVPGATAGETTSATQPAIKAAPKTAPKSEDKAATPDPKEEYRDLCRQYKTACRELERAVERSAKATRDGTTSNEAYGNILNLRDKKDLLYTRITFMAMRYNYEVPKVDAKASTAPVDPKAAFGPAKALVLENLADDVARAVKSVQDSDSFKSPACNTLVN